MLRIKISAMIGWNVLELLKNFNAISKKNMNCRFLIESNQIKLLIITSHSHERKMNIFVIRNKKEMCMTTEFASVIHE
jgi:hypothetical protein